MKNNSLAAAPEAERKSGRGVVHEPRPLIGLKEQCLHLSVRSMCSDVYLSDMTDT